MSRHFPSALALFLPIPFHFNCPFYIFPSQFPTISGSRVLSVLLARLTLPRGRTVAWVGNLCQAQIYYMTAKSTQKINFSTSPLSSGGGRAVDFHFMVLLWHWREGLLLVRRHCHFSTQNRTLPDGSRDVADDDWMVSWWVERRGSFLRSPLNNTKAAQNISPLVENDSIWTNN